MGLYIYLELDVPFKRPPSSGIFIRENGRQKEITREEWDRRHPDREPVCMRCQDDMTTTAYHGHITHNLIALALATDLYEPLWHPDEHGIERANQLIEPLEAGLVKLCAQVDTLKELDPPNKWGSHDVFVEFVKEVLEACKAHPKASVVVSR